MAEIIVTYTLGQTGFERYNNPLANLLREVARLSVAALNHSHIGTLYDVGPNFLVMELVEGESSQEY